MATGALNAQGVWIYGEDDSETTFSSLLNKLGASVSSNMKGRILQIVSVKNSTNTTNSTGTYVDTGLTATITPTATTSKILVLVNQQGVGKSTTDTTVQLRLLRNGTLISQIANSTAWSGSGSSNTPGSASTNAIDSPATTSAVTYKTQIAAFSATSQVFVNQNVGSGSPDSTLTLIEISA